jgi:hypothetical protein
MLAAIPKNGLGIFDRGFSGLEHLQSAAASKQYFSPIQK